MVALVEAHALGELELQAEGVGLLDRDDAFLADLVHSLGDELTDGRVAGGNTGGSSDLLLGVDLLGGLEQASCDSLDSLLDAALEAERVRAGCDVAQAFTDQSLCENGSGGGAVASDVVSLLGDLLDELGADLLVRVVEFDLLGDGNTIVGDRGGAPLLFENDVATLGAQRHLDSVGEGVEASLEATTCLFVERDDLCHCEVILRIGGDTQGDRSSGHLIGTRRPFDQSPSLHGRPICLVTHLRLWSSQCPRRTTGGVYGSRSHCLDLALTVRECQLHF